MLDFDEMLFGTKVLEPAVHDTKSRSCNGRAFLLGDGPIGMMTLRLCAPSCVLIS